MSKHVDKRIRRFERKTLPSVKIMDETILGYKDGCKSKLGKDMASLRSSIK